MKSEARFELRMPTRIKSRLRAAAKRDGRSLAQFIIRAADAAARAQALRKQLDGVVQDIAAHVPTPEGTSAA